MAKQMSVIYTDFATCSSILQHPSLLHYERPPRSRHHKPRPMTAHQRLAPSSAILTLLATIAASSFGVDASPAPLSFLCPSIDFISKRHASRPVRRSVSPKKPTLHIPPLPKPKPKPPVKRNWLVSRSVPDKYEEGPDGRWRRVDSPTLYGLTVCPVSTLSPLVGSPRYHSVSTSGVGFLSCHVHCHLDFCGRLHVLRTIDTHTNPLRQFLPLMTRYKFHRTHRHNRRASHPRPITTTFSIPFRMAGALKIKITMAAPHSSLHYHLSSHHSFVF